MLSEVTINKFSQLVYLDVVPGKDGKPLSTVGELADYYGGTELGKLYIKTRFGQLPREYAGWVDFLAGGLEDVRDFTLCNILDDNQKRQTGFYACGYRSPDGELVAAFRGSEMLGNAGYKNDYQTDFSLAWAEKTAQQKMVDTYLATFPDFRRPYSLTGHSLGGNLALYGAVCAPNQALIRGCYAFNAPGFNNEFVQDNRERIAAVAPRLYPYQNTHDIVSSLLQNIVAPIILASAFNPNDEAHPSQLDLFYPHSNFVFQRDGEKFVREASGKKDPLCDWINRLSILFLNLPGFVKRGVSALILEVIYSTQPPEKQLQFLLERLTKFFTHNQLADLDGGGLALSSGLYTASQLMEKPLSGSEIYKTLQASQLREEVYLAQACILLLKLLQYTANAGKHA